MNRIRFSAPHIGIVITSAVLALSVIAPSRAQTVRLNEVMPSNTVTLADEDGDYPDWFELYNTSASPVELTGFGLSDDAATPAKWVVPALVLQPAEYRVVFASGKGSAAFTGTWSTVVDRGDVFRYRIWNTEPPPQWTDPGFDDSAWSTGPSGFGYGDGDDATVVPSTLSLHARISFSVADPAAVDTAIFHVDYDDGYVAYLNGFEIARANVGAPGARPAYNQLAAQATEPRSTRGLLPEAVALENVASLLRAGENVLSVQVHNASSSSSDLSIIPYLTLGFTGVPPGVRNPPPELGSSFAHALHTSFRLSAGGELLMLTDVAGAVVDSIRFGPIPADLSLGRQPDGTGLWRFFDVATPGMPNTGQGYDAYLQPPAASVAGGRFAAPLQVALSSIAGASIHYTTDGSEPTDLSPTYTGPISVSQTLPLRARALQSRYLPSPVATHTYIIGDNTSLPVFSIAMDPTDLWDEQTGIYVMGPNAEPAFPHFGANFWQDWEKPINVELFESDGTVGLSQRAGVKIMGGWSRAYDQRSLALFARGGYGSPDFPYSLFPQRQQDSYQTLVLRNSGNDWISTMMRDAYLQVLMRGTEIDRVEYRPSILYLNGEYWGIHNLREKINEHYAAGLAGIGRDQIDLLAIEDGNDPDLLLVVHGDDEHYRELLGLLGTLDMTTTSAYTEVGKRMDLENFIDYQLAQIFVGNTDWPGNNVKFWRPKTADGRWRWIAFDLDFGFGIWNREEYTHNTLAFAAEPNGPEWPNPPQSTFVFRKLLENADFRAAFVHRFADLTNVHFREERLVAVLDSVKSLIDDEMPRHLARWGRGSFSAWISRLADMAYFGRNRGPVMDGHFRSFFGLGTRVPITVESSAGGSVRVNRETIPQSPWTGTYFPNFPLPLTAVPQPGYRFAGWSGDVVGVERNLTVTPVAGLSLRADFEPAGPSPDVYINEIHYNPPPDMDSEDWVELANSESGPVDLAGWQLVDGNGNTFTIPNGTQIGSGGYVVLARDTLAFAAVYPAVPFARGVWPFGLSNAGEAVKLVDAGGVTVDSLTYAVLPPWPVEADGAGSSLELVDPIGDRTSPVNWKASSVRGGTPGGPNSGPVGTDEDVVGLPVEFALGKPYPNPFQAYVVVPFATTRHGNIRLEVFDTLGRRVATLLDGPAPAGYHSVRWNAEGVPSGLYVIRLSIDDQTLASDTVVRIR